MESNIASTDPDGCTHPCLWSAMIPPSSQITLPATWRATLPLLILMAVLHPCPWSAMIPPLLRLHSPPHSESNIASTDPDGCTHPCLWSAMIPTLLRLHSPPHRESNIASTDPDGCTPSMSLVCHDPPSSQITLPATWREQHCLY